MRRRVSPEFGEAVQRVLKEHNLSDRGAQYKTEINRTTMSEMRNGYVPQLEQVIRFAKGFGLDVNEWLALAGYELMSSGDESQPSYRPLTYEPDLDEVDVAAFLGKHSGLPPEDVQPIREVMEALIRDKRRERGLE